MGVTLVATSELRMDLLLPQSPTWLSSMALQCSPMLVGPKISRFPDPVSDPSRYGAYCGSLALRYQCESTE